MSDTLSDDINGSVLPLEVLAFEGLPHSMVVVDRNGTIVETNDRWEEFARENGQAVSAVNAGTDYLAAIDPSESESARRAKAGLEAILEGERSEFTLEYPCHGPETERWFLMWGAGFDTKAGRFVTLLHVDITDLKRRERRLQESNTAQKALFDGIPEAVFVADSEGQFTAVNETACDRLGYDKEELVGKTPKEIVGKEFENRIEEQVDRVLEEGIVTFESIHVTSDGDRIPVEIIATPIEYFGERRILSVARDISERKTSERRLAREKELFGAFSEAYPDIAFLIDEDGRYLDVLSSPVSDDLILSMTSDITGNRVQDVFPPDAAKRMTAIIEKALAADTVQTYAYELEVPAGQRWFEARVTPVPSGVDGKRAVIWVARDVTERKRKEDRLEEYRAQYQRIVDRSPTPILAFGEDGRILEANDAAVNLLGVSDRSNLVGTALETHIPDPHIERIQGRLNSVLDGEIVEALQHPIIGADGERRKVISTGVPDERPGETAAVAFVTDVTTQAERERSFQRLQESSREFLVADTPAQIGEEMVDLAADLFDITGAILFHYDRSVGRLRPVATDGSSTAEGQIEPVEPGDGIVGETFVGGNSRAEETGRQELSKTLGNPGTVYSVSLLGEGVFVAGFADSGSIDDDRVDIIEALANNGAAAIKGLHHRSQIETTEQEVEDLQQTVQDLRLTLGLLSDLWETIDQSESRPEIERETCEKLLTGPGVVGAWIGEQNRVTDSVETKAETGVAAAITDHVDYPLDDDSSSIPAVRALRESEPALQRFGDSTVVESTDEWARRVQTTDVGLVYSVPIADTDNTYGVLTVFVDEGSIDSRITGLRNDLQETLGEILTHAFNSLDRRQALVSDQQFELTYRISGQNCLFSEMANVLDGQVTFEKLVQKTDSTTTVFVTMYDTDPAAVRALPSKIGAIHEAEILRRRSTNRITARIDIIGQFIGTQLSTWGANVSDITTEESATRVVLSVPNSDLVSSIQTSLEDQFSSVQMVSKRRFDDTETAPTTEREQFKDRLTERQLEVFQTAYHAGYFESPRETNGEDIADILGISSQAFYQHIRTIQRKLAVAVIEE
ncbi:MAG: PAS domain S-box-containing protein [Halobacteriales archaeon]|jgi:PAS domain S-box-containing protein